MKKLISLILILVSVNAYGFKLPWAKSEEEQPEEIKDTPTVCHAALQVSENNGARVFYIYRTLCVDIELVAILSEPENKIIHLKDLKLGDSYIYKSAEGRFNYLDKFFPNIRPLPFYTPPKNKN